MRYLRYIKVSNTELTALQTYVSPLLCSGQGFALLLSSFRRHIGCSLVSQISYNRDIFALLPIKFWLRAESLIELVFSKSLQHQISFLITTHPVLRQGLLVLAH